MSFSVVAKRILTPKAVDLSNEHTDKALRCMRDPEHPERPHILTVAENVLCWKQLSKHMAEYSTLHQNDNMYAVSYDGREYLKKAFSDILSNIVFRAPIPEDDIIVVAGSGAVMDIMGTALLDPEVGNQPSDAFMCITPCYNSFNNNFSLRNGSVMYKVDTTDTNYVITDDALEAAYATAEKDGRKMMVFTNPNNPTGSVYSENEMRIVLEFCRRHDIHLFSDEIYAMSVKPESEREEGENQFVSFAKFIEKDEKKDDVTCLWGFSKDVGLSGFRLSVLYCPNKNLHKVLNELIHFCEVPANTQSFACNLLSDKKYMKSHFECLQKRVLEMRRFVESRLDEMKIPYVHGIAGFFIWMNLRAYLKEDSYEGEQELYKWIYEHGNLILAPGRKYNPHEPGWFRWIFTCYEEDEMGLAIKGLEKALKERKDVNP